ncbi:MAG: hypothetical protein L6Q98_20890 [Anaerolineae bacterium]|nr:hypothetical protein [Anaerolineae bacterium]NUQ06267.1 hypothetical protein [Anaerolineae bacterium]
MLTNKPLLLGGIGLGLVSAWLPYALLESGDPFDGVSMLSRFLYTSGGTTNTFNFTLFLPFIVLTIAYAIAFTMALRLSDDSQPMGRIAGWIGCAAAAHLLIMMISISEGMMGVQTPLYISPENFVPGIGMGLFILAVPCIAGGWAGCWRELRNAELERQNLRLLERIQALEKAAGVAKPL